MEKLKFEFTNQEVETIYRALLEMPAKSSLSVMQSMEMQVRAQEVKEKEKVEETSEKSE